MGGGRHERMNRECANAWRVAGCPRMLSGPIGPPCYNAGLAGEQPAQKECNGMGVIVADGMGLGKTRQAITYVHDMFQSCHEAAKVVSIVVSARWNPSGRCLRAARMQS